MARAVASGADTGTLIPAGSVLVLAVSGGPDSMALLVGTAALVEQRRWRAAVAHLDHGLRRESADDAAFVRAAATQFGLPFHAARVDVARLARERHRSIEESGREARYAFLEGVAAALDPGALVVTAHTADDNAETILLNIARGTGVSGLHGIPVRRGRIVRPLLGVRRQALHEWLVASGTPFRTDATNLDERYSRARVRTELLPSLERLNPSAVEALLRLGRLAADDDQLLTDLASAELAARRLVDPPLVALDTASEAGAVRLDWHDPPRRAIGRRVLRLALGAAPAMERVEALLDAAAGGRGGTLIELGGGRSATVRGRIISLSMPGD